MRVDECPICEKGTLRRKKASYEMYGISFGKFPAEVCDRCGETFFGEKVCLDLERIAKRKGLWAIEKKIKIAYSGNTLTVHIPKAIAELLKLERGEVVLIRPGSLDKIIIERPGREEAEA